MGGGEGGNLRGFRVTKGARGSVKIHMSRHEKHIAGTKNYNQQRQNGKSYGSVKRWSIMVELLDSIIMKRRTSIRYNTGRDPLRQQGKRTYCAGKIQSAQRFGIV